jgi:shikimate 5-dehydrogenase/shikimate kinase
MRWVLVGHRGTGKSSLLQRMVADFSDLGLRVPIYDLDYEIEKYVGQNLSEFFKHHGELRFREKEIEVFELLALKNAMFVIALGAGFPVEKIPKDVKKIWIRRKTDSQGRIFLNRPRLDQNLDPLSEYRSRYVQRESNFQHVADWVYTLPEGLRARHPLEQQFFFGSSANPQGILTVMPHHLREPRPVSFAQTIELRDDLLNESELRQAVKLFPHKNFIYSHRQFRERKVNLPETATIDWASELGELPLDFKGIISFHERPDGLSLEKWMKHISTFGKKDIHLKLSPLISGFADLKELLQWQKEAPEIRSIFPRSMDGRWSWFRHLWAYRQQLHFWQDGLGSALDQPLWWEQFGYPIGKVMCFAAVLGESVLGSYSPWRHFEQFRNLGMPFYAITIHEPEFDLAWTVLCDLGLEAAAVTSPLKEPAVKKAALKSKLVIKTGVTNTLSFVQKKWRADLTDPVGFAALVEEVEKQSAKPGIQWKALLWGGGGTLPTVKTVLPDAVSFSVRTGKPRDKAIKFGPNSFDFLIWAASPDAELPPKELQFSFIVDLNYKEDSRARELAQIRGIPYFLGLKMFEEQAAAQGRIWKEL